MKTEQKSSNCKRMVWNPVAHRILLLCSDTVDRIRLRGAFATSGYQVEALDEPEALASLEPLPHVIVAAPGRDRSFDFAALSRTARRDECQPPAIVAFGPADALTRLSAIRAGCADFVDDTALLRARLRDILRIRTTLQEMRRRMAAARYLGLAEDRVGFTRPPRIALVGDVSDAIEIAAARRTDWRVERCAPARILGDGHRADVYVLAPDCGADTLLPELRARRNSRRAAIVVLHRDGATEEAVRALDARASDALPATASGEEVALRLERALARKSDEERLRRQTDAGLRFALTDALTGLHNRRYAEAYIAEMLSSDHAAPKSYAALMIDIDRFKEVNDTRGHATGDETLRLLADVLRDNLRSMDLVARLGGDEFLILMPATLPNEAGIVAERLRARFETEVGRLRLEIPVTLSVGVAIRANPGERVETPEDLIAAADRALYAAKSGGRNCVRLTAAA